MNAPLNKPWLTSSAMVSILLLALIGCGQTPITSLYQLSKIDAKTTNLSKLRVAVQVPKPFQPTKHGVVLSLRLEERKSEPSFSEEFKLVQFSAASQNKLRAKYQNTERHFYFFKLAATDIQRFEQFRKIQAGGNGIKERPGSLTISANVCRRIEKIPPSIYISTFLKTSETKKFIPLILNHNIMEDVEPTTADDIAPLCKQGN